MAQRGLPEGVTSRAQTEPERVGGKGGIQGLEDPQMAPGSSGAWGKEEGWSWGGAASRK